MVVCALLAGLARADETKEKSPAPAFPREDVEFFETSVRPLLVANCRECHGPRKQEGKLRLDSREAVLAGGESGPAVVPGDPKRSLLISAVQHAEGGPQMPPKGRLDDEKIAVLTRWVKLNAPWSAATTAKSDAATATIGDFQIRPEDRQFWSFRPVVDPAPPAVQDAAWPKTPIDSFILAGLEAQGLTPAPAADRRTLLRRVTFDLTGLPPTPDEVRAFLADDAPDAYAKVVERLLASPRYGERMARLWLDVARFGEDQAHTFEARKYPQGFRYRDWVVASFNCDLPYDEFVRQQIAADLLEAPDPNCAPEALREQAPESGAPGADPLAADPDPRLRLAALGFFACGPVYYGDKNAMDQIADRIDTVSRGFLGLTVACARCHDHKYDPISTVDYYALAGVFASTEYVEVPLVSLEEVEAAEKSLSDKERKEKNRPKKYPFIHALKDASQPRNLQVHVRGNAETLGPEAPRRFLEILSDDAAATFTSGSGRRELAEAIASPQNPLTARVFVNRIWLAHFGRGLVRTPSNFGLFGERPTHPELLDYLAARFMESGWSIKDLHRLIVLSATYQQSADAAPPTEAADPENFLWGRAGRRRLQAEQWRDAMLAVAGQLSTEMGGPSQDLAASDNRRRTLYGFVSRHELNPFLRLFDFPDPNITSDQRVVTTVPLQQLFVLNSEFMVERARALALRLQADEPAGDRARIERAFELLFARPATAEEIELGLSYLSAPDLDAEDIAPKLSRWERYCQVLLGTNEFLHVD
jgi:mono/diheme cytochrome c family protein